MNRILSSARVVLPVLMVFGAGLLLAPARNPESARGGPWRVVISKPIVGLGWTAGTLYSEHEYLGDMFNQLDRDGLVPVQLQIMTERPTGREAEDRMLVLCRPK